MPDASAQTDAFLVERPEFRRLVPESATLERLATGFRFTEGPAWHPTGNFLVFSDIPADRMHRFDPATGQVEPFREPSEHANGNTYAPDGTLYTCEHGSRRVRVLRPGGETPEVLVERAEGKLFNSPNDIVVKRDGTVWFTDPDYGLDKRPREQPAHRVYRFDPRTGETKPVLDDFEQPNGLCFSPDERRLYVADSGKPRHVRVFDVAPDGTLSNGRVFCTIDKGVPDGIRCDGEGNLFSSAGDGVHVFNPAGERLGKILVPETTANLCFGGPDGRDLYLTASKSLYRVRLTASGKLEH